MDTKRIIADIDAEISKLQRILYDKMGRTVGARRGLCRHWQPFLTNGSFQTQRRATRQSP
jgi:hypothetical protein